MPKSTTPSVRDLGNRRRSLAARIHADERALAIAYPNEIEERERNLATWRVQLAELEPQIEEAKETVANDLRDALDRYFEARSLLYLLNGHASDPGFDDGIFASVHLGGSIQSVEGVKAALLRATEIEPFEYPDVPEHQRMHEERVRNERAGRGHYTDRDVVLMAQNPAAFHGGQGARRVQTAPGYEPPAKKQPGVHFFR